MPPKAGTRRGASSAAARNNNGGDPGSNATPAATSNTSASPAPTSTTSTPGTTRAPVQRLQSLKNRTPSGSIGPGPTSAGSGNGEPSKPTLKYKPRAVGRRSKEEREAIEKLEAQRNAERLKEAAAIQRQKANIAARGREGFAGRGGRGGSMSGAAGPLGSGFGGVRRGRGGSRFGGDSRATSMSRRSKSMTAGAGGAGGSVSSDESDGEIRVSIDRINLESDADDDDDDVILDQKKKKLRKGKMALGSARETGLRPIRVERHEHEERVISVNMESSTTKSAELRQQAKDKSKDDDALFVQDDDETPTEGEPRVKQEPTDENDQTMADVPPVEEHVTTDDGLLPAPKKKVRRKLGSREPSVPAPAKDPKSLLRTKEDIEEYDRHVEDLELIKDLFTKEPPAKTKEPEATEGSAGADTDGADVTPDESGKEKTEEGGEEEPTDDKLSGQLFLMQFPPITPNLIEPSADGAVADSEATAIPLPAAQSAAQKPVAERTQADLAALKREEEVEVLDGQDEQTETGAPSKVVTAADWQLKAGQAGKLNVHASGRVTMNWGGISFELDRATAVDFLQEALIVSTPPNATEDLDDDEHKVWAMGQLSGKFTVTPDWGKML
ncbi:RNA polymerase III RPC4-domain-containing protein [Aspergillus karnatakaensis]|uniref:putative DNA-directed RNA polymerase III RPC4 n=1 Tax=Aspergillus karnatakaensis TaxID=1810916 RepID=UPI003CCD4EEB